MSLETSYSTSPRMLPTIASFVGRGDYDGPTLRAVLAELDSEAVAGPHTRAAADRGLQAGMVGDERGDPRPGREAVQGLDEARAYQGAGAVASSSRPAEG